MVFCSFVSFFRTFVIFVREGDGVCKYSFKFVLCHLARGGKGATSKIREQLNNTNNGEFLYFSGTAML